MPAPASLPFWIRLHPAAFLFLLSLALRLAWMAGTYGNTPLADAQCYAQLGRTLAAENAYLLDGHPSAYWPVGYPFFLSGFFRLWENAFLPVKLAQCLLSSAIPVLIFRLARIWGCRRPWAMGGALAFAAFPSSLSAASSLLTETLFAFLLFSSFYLAHRRRGYASLLSAGLVLGAACYVRPVALVLIPLFHLHEALRGKWRAYLGATLLLSSLVAATALPWALRNHALFGRFVLYTTNFGANLYMGHNPAARGGYQDTPELSAIMASDLDESAQSRVLAGSAFRYMFSHPAHEAELFFRKLAALLFQERMPIYETLVREPVDAYNASGVQKPFTWRRKSLTGFNNLYYLAMLGLFLGIPWWKKIRSDPLLATCAALFWIQPLFYCAFFSADRYKYPAIPFALLAIALYRGRIGPVPRTLPG